MRSRYDSRVAEECRARYAARYGDDLADRVYTSRLLGSDPSLVLHGGGNTSVKSVAREIDGAEVRVLYVKGSGGDLGGIEPEGFPACRLDPLLRYCALPSLSDEQMVRALRSQMLDPSSPTPSVEALLHAYLPGKFVDHTHADAVLSVVDTPNSAARAREIWGDDLIFVPYVMPGFALARQIVACFARSSRATTLVLDKHGIFTWGDSAEQSYLRMIEAVTRAEDYLARTLKRGVTVADDGRSATERKAQQRRLSLVLRGGLERADAGGKMVVCWRDEPEILSLLARPDAKALTQIGTATPDHAIRTKPFPLWLGRVSDDVDDRALRAQCETRLQEYGAEYDAYFRENVGRYGAALTRLDPLPRLMVSPGLGALCVGKTLKEAQIAGDIYLHTSQIIERAASLGGYEPVSLSDLFDVEYWSLEQAKLKSQKAPSGTLARQIALVTGAASGIGLETAATFLAEGAHVMLSDLDATRLDEVATELRRRFGSQVAWYAADVTDEAAIEGLLDHTVERFGGLDVVVSNAGNAPMGKLHESQGQEALLGSLQLNFLSHQRLAAAASRRLLLQGSGGCLLFNASKSAFNPGPEFGPYAVPKAALVALMKQYAIDLAADGIRANAVNADRIRTGLFSEALLENRARARGVSVEDYFKANLLRRETRSRDVAQAFVYLASAEATTGTVISVDGGNPAAFPR